MILLKNNACVFLMVHQEYYKNIFSVKINENDPNNHNYFSCTRELIRDLVYESLSIYMRTTYLKTIDDELKIKSFNKLLRHSKTFIA